MKRVTLCITFLVFSSIAAFGQAVDRSMSDIRLRYNDLAEKARLCETDDDRGEFGDLVMNTLAVNSRSHQWRAVGIHTQTFKFFYNGGDSEQHLYPDRLVFVKTERRESNRNYAEEFLYSDAGVLIFYFQKAENDNEVPAERRIYFSGPKVVRIIEDAKSRDRFSQKDTQTVGEVVSESKKIKEIFARSINL